MQILQSLNEYLDVFISSFGFYGVLLSCFLLLIEPLLPILPAALFVTLNFVFLGSMWGFLVSWIFLCVGCVFAFMVFRSRLKKYFIKKIEKHSKVKNFMKRVDNVKFAHFVMFAAIPVFPDFLVNITAAFSSMSLKKFVVGIIIGKAFAVYIWGFIGTSLISSLTDPKTLLFKCGILLVVYVISTAVSKKINLDGGQ